MEPTPLSETTPKAPPPTPPPPSPRRLQLGPPPLLTPQSRDISGAAPASSTEDYAEPQAHVPQTEDNASTPAPAPSTEENASPPAPAPSTEENTSPPASVPSTEENTSTPAPEMVPLTEDNEEPGDSGESGCFEMVPEPVRSGEAAAVLSIVYVNAADISDDP